MVNDQPVLYGVTSWGIGCGEFESPGIYATVAVQIDWFGEVIYNISRPTEPPATGTNGMIALQNYQNDHDQIWYVNSDCEHGVRIISESFSTEGCCDYVTIDGTEYSGSGVAVDQLVDNYFNVSFSSDGSITGSGFVLIWMCDGEYGSGDYTTGTTTTATTITNAYGNFVIKKNKVFVAQIKPIILGCACYTIYVDNNWTTGMFTRGGMINGKYYWVDSSRYYAIWYDGHSSYDFDWMFGYFSDLGSTRESDALMHSDQETTCPHDVSSWTNDYDAIVTCGKRIHQLTLMLPLG